MRARRVDRRSGDLLLRAIPLALLLAAGPARGDGGLMCVSERAGPFVVSLFTAPTPLRVGPVDVSVLVQNADDRAPVLDSSVEIALRGSDLEQSASATHATATNKLLYAAALTVPAAGRWTVRARVREGHRTAAVSCEVDVAPPAPPVATFWPYLALPFVLGALFVLHQRLKMNR